MWTHVDRQRGSQKSNFFVDVINGWPPTSVNQSFFIALLALGSTSTTTRPRPTAFRESFSEAEKRQRQTIIGTIAILPTRDLFYRLPVKFFSQNEASSGPIDAKQAGTNITKRRLSQLILLLQPQQQAYICPNYCNSQLKCIFSNDLFWKNFNFNTKNLIIFFRHRPYFVCLLPVSTV